MCAATAFVAAASAMRGAYVQGLPEEHSDASQQ